MSGSMSYKIQISLNKCSTSYGLGQNFILLRVGFNELEYMWNIWFHFLFCVLHWCILPIINIIVDPTLVEVTFGQCNWQDYMYKPHWWICKVKRISQLFKVKKSFVFSKNEERRKKYFSYLREMSKMNSFLNAKILQQFLTH